MRPQAIPATIFPASSIFCAERFPSSNNTGKASLVDEISATLNSSEASHKSSSNRYADRQNNCLLSAINYEHLFINFDQTILDRGKINYMTPLRHFSGVKNPVSRRRLGIGRKTIP
jgi:hypothetical protein